MSKILILGDLHGRFHDLKSVMKNVDFNLNIKYNFVVQIGDFGFYKNMFEVLNTLETSHVYNKTTKTRDLIHGPMKFHKPVHAIDGNHEQHDWLKLKCNLEEIKEKHNIIYQPRGSYLDIDGCKIGFIGGALNVDRAQEGSTAKGTTNYILNKEVEQAANTWNSIGGVDVVFSHSCPANIGIGIEGSDFFNRTIVEYIINAGHPTCNQKDCGELALTKLYTKLEKKPKHWFFGHFHDSLSKVVSDTEFICVGTTDSSDGKKYVNPFIYDTKTKSYEYHNKKAMNFDGEHSTWIAD